MVNTLVFLPFVIKFGVSWFILGGLSGNEKHYYALLIGVVTYIIFSLLYGFKVIYKLASKDSSPKEKKIFAIGMIIFIIAVILFMSFI